MDAAALLCNICPKRPRFSDVSHLLTHVSSKAHLSHYFKLQVRSHQEPQAVASLDEYDRWYKSNNLAKLLSDRMSSKEVRKKKPQGKATTHKGASAAGRNNGYRVPPPSVCPLPSSSLPDYLDPRLSDSSLKEDPETANGSVIDSRYISPDAHPASDCQDHDGTQLPSLCTLPSKDPVNPIFNQWRQEHGTNVEDEMQSTPSWSGALEFIADKASQSLDTPLNYDPFIDDNYGEMDKERAEEIARLKGVLWPGMDIFDSATEQMRRKRNQKKDESILKMMEKTSMCVEPTELIFSPTGVLRKQRVISGNVEDSSPLKGETPVPKRRANHAKRGILRT
ncbi:hypothetical protein EYZ11_001199 [Aspergillus tanneri]|uniref:Uncharacterized protein n=1 Tax=Aspergillus tanneri TaxID=1220188 RepID=A0A4S3JV83_9EURO|nr:hypothetical protein EYZ11_001199 [Aspergillus tanneri]